MSGHGHGGGGGDRDWTNPFAAFTYIFSDMVDHSESAEDVRNGGENKGGGGGHGH